MDPTPSRGGRPKPTYEITAYTLSDKGMNGRGITASGTRAKPGRTIAAGPEIPFGTKVIIEGVGERIVEDRGGAIRHGHIDLLVSDTKTALEFGRQHLKVHILDGR
ncbi:hypothetical protein GJ688_01865 [Heliobacillus mobilis]|uniref:3D domain-containing protein n=2 Tax=Heliobacterium mobile TaxID=28064 RepID=A0A6I3SBL2_HELMO|nr:hypothetical protein [Heliobacterium mobile]